MLYYIIVAIYKYFLHWYKYKYNCNYTIKPIECRTNFVYKGENITILTIFELLYENPVKWSFYYFYNIMQISFMVKNKSSIFRIFKDFKLFKIIFKKFIFRYIVLVLTTYPFIIITNTGYVSKLLSKYWYLNWNKFIEFYSNFILNLTVHYNNVNFYVAEKIVVFDEEEIYTNSIDKTKINTVKDAVKYGITNQGMLNSALHSFVNNSDTQVARFGSSEIVLMNRFQTADEKTSLSVTKFHHM